MLHTAHFYVDLTKEELQFLEINLGVSFDKVAGKSDEYAAGFTTWVIKHYGIRLHFVIDFIKLLNNETITENDYHSIEEHIKGYLFFLLQDMSVIDRVVMIRIDYRHDVRLPKDIRNLILFLYKKTAEKHRHQKKYDQHKTTIYFNSKSVQVTCYDKEEEVIANGRRIEPYEKDVLRFEVRLQNRHLKHMKYKKGKEKWLEEYFQQDLFERYMTQYLESIIFKGDYYKINKAKTIINQSPYTEAEKEQLIEFLKYVSKNGIEKAKKTHSRYLYKKFILQLKSLNINPILIPKNRQDFPSFLKNPFNI